MAAVAKHVDAERAGEPACVCPQSWQVSDGGQGVLEESQEMLVSSRQHKQQLHQEQGQLASEHETFMKTLMGVPSPNRRGRPHGVDDIVSAGGASGALGYRERLRVSGELALQRSVTWGVGSATLDAGGDQQQLVLQQDAQPRVLCGTSPSLPAPQSPLQQCAGASSVGDAARVEVAPPPPPMLPLLGGAPGMLTQPIVPMGYQCQDWAPSPVIGLHHMDLMSPMHQNSNSFPKDQMPLQELSCDEIAMQLMAAAPECYED